MIRQQAEGKDRIVIGIAGAPGSGKSTIAEGIAAELPHAAVLPMDGFHLDNSDLREMGRLHRKGAPDTFDAEGFVQLVRRLRTKSDLTYPTFSRELDKTLPDAGRLDQSTRIVLVEGNYLLLNLAPWHQLAAHFDLTVGLSVSRDLLEQRLVQRWLDQGLSPAAARARAHDNDMKNADFILAHSMTPDVTVGSAQ